MQRKYVTFLRMTRDVIDQVRAGIESKSFTMTELAEVCQMPVTTLATMLKPDWGKHVYPAVDRIERLKVGMAVIAEKNRERA